MFSFLNKTDNNSSSFPWKNVESIDLLNKIINSDRPILLFKHSTRCIISKTVKDRFERMAQESSVDMYLVHVIEERPYSNHIAEISGVTHQSPQALIFKSGECLYNESHDSILDEQILSYL